MYSENQELQGNPELVVIFKKDAQVRTNAKTELVSEKISKEQLAPLQKILTNKNVSLNHLFARKGKTMTMPKEAQTVFSGLKLDVGSFMVAQGSKVELQKIQKQLILDPNVEAAYLKPPATEPDGPTPDLSANQGYLNASPQGVDANFAWNFNGGRGEGIDVIDVERGWNLTHEDLQGKVGTLLGGSIVSTSKNHGTAVLGVIGANENALGMKGIAHNSFMRPISHNGLGTAQAIIDAADALNAGDIILLEVHRPGPAASGDGQDGFIAIEWWPDDFAAIVYATSKGIIVVEAAGNGSEDFDTEIYNKRPSGFPASWRNPFNLTNPQSGAIIVGAGSPVAGLDRTILGFSNWGARVDCQGWGSNVATLGYGNLQGGNENVWYTNSFNGTSSASPVVTGAIACTQGRLKAAGKPLLTPTTARNLVRSTGAPQMRLSGIQEQDAPSSWKGIPATFGTKIDAALWNGKSDRLYMFSGSQYLKINPNDNWSVEPEYPKPIAGNWPGFPASFTSGINAALWSNTNNKVYFFKGNQYLRVDPNNGWNVDAGYPKPIAGNWPGFPATFAAGVDAAIWNSKNNKIYFFKGSQFIRVDPANQFTVEAGYPKPIAGNWPGLTSSFATGIDAALWSGTNNKIYFFKGENYVRIDPFNNWNQDAGYPKLTATNRIGNRPDLKQMFRNLNIDSNWPGFPSSFGNNLDAALWADSNGKAYFFKGNQYLRVDPNNNWQTESGYPKPIAGNWPGFPANFAAGVDAAVGTPVNNKIYFFKGNQYIKVDPNNNWNVEPGYPKPIAGNWPGFPASFAAGIDAAVWSDTNSMIYFFKGNQYIKVNPNNNWNVEPGYPKPIAGNWPTLPAPFTNTINCALWNDKSKRIYFFSGTQYVRIDPNNGWKVDKYYPKPIIR